MGASNSTLSTLVDGSSEGYHVLSVYENSPGAEAKLQAYFDFIIAVGEFHFCLDFGLVDRLQSVN